jgi:potassium voltage-gated channel Shal-related subfamily D protein 2
MARRRAEVLPADLISLPSRPSRRQSRGMPFSSSIPLTRLRGATPIHDEIQEVDEIFHNLNASVILDAPDTVPGPQWKQDLHALLEQPTSSSSAFIMHVFITSLIIISALVTVFETVPAFRKISNAVWFGFETTLVALFTMEYIARTLAWSGSWRLYFQWATCMSCLCSFLLLLLHFSSFSVK